MNKNFTVSKYRSRKIKKRNKYYAPEGHKLRSKGEFIIEQWLHENGVQHIYEPKSSEYAKYVPDWLTASRHIVEFFGYYEARKEYKERTQKKIKYFKRKFGKKFIAVYYDDLSNLDEVLKPVLK